MQKLDLVPVVMTSTLRQSARRYHNLTSSASLKIPTRTFVISPISSFPTQIYPKIPKQNYSSVKDFVPVEAMEAIKQTVAQNMGVSGAHTLVPEHQQFSLDETPDLSDKVAVITGDSLKARGSSMEKANTASRRLRRHRLWLLPYTSVSQHRQDFHLIYVEGCDQWCSQCGQGGNG